MSISVLVSGPASEPITLAQARLHLKEDTVGSDIDGQITILIKVVRELCENDCRRVFISQQWKTTIDCFPGTYPLNYYGPRAPDCNTWYLPRTPIISIDAINYVDDSNAPQSLGVTSTTIATNLADGTISPAFGTSWPAIQRGSPVSVTYTAGYGVDASTVPSCAIQWMLMALGTAYEMRQSELVGSRAVLIESAFADRLLDPIRVRRY